MALLLTGSKAADVSGCIARTRCSQKPPRILGLPLSDMPLGVANGEALEMATFGTNQRRVGSLRQLHVR